MTEHREKRLIAERKITELKTNKDNKGKIEHEEMLRQLKSAFKEEVATLKCEVCAKTVTVVVFLLAFSESFT